MASFIRFAFAPFLVAGCLGDTTSDLSSAATGSGGGGEHGNVHGAIFTTTADGSRVDANIYAAKPDVYLDGGPGDGAPSSAAALPEGDYYFQVTDPSGKHVLSLDDVECRRIHIDGSGVIDVAYPGPGCQHVTGVDLDHGSLTVQLMPYADTPNHGGEYKAWVTPVGDLGEDGEFVDRFSKKDNFKVRAPDDDEQPPSCGNGVLEQGEQCDDGNTSDGDGCSATCQTEMTPPPPSPCCGNGVIESGEACDDGNTASGDGCSATCELETPPPPPVCGNGVLEDGEGCDDGNLDAGDGCSATCELEPCEGMDHLYRMD